MVAKNVEVEKVIKKVETLQQEYNEQNQVHLKPIMIRRLYRLTLIDQQGIMVRWKLLMYNGTRIF
jgi:hypothetical protein